MRIHADWFDERKTIVLWTFPPKWTLDDLHTTYDHTSQLIREVNHWTHAIIDLRNSGVPNLISSAINSRARTDPPNHDMSVIVSDSLLIASFVNMFGHFPYTRDKFHMATTLEEALAFCEQRQAELKDTPVPKTR